MRAFFIDVSAPNPVPSIPVSRRSLLSGAGATVLAGFRPVQSDGVALPVGLPDGLGIGPVTVRVLGAAALGRPVAVCGFPSPACLRDHFKAGMIAAAVLPLAEAGLAVSARAFPHETPRATLLVSRDSLRYRTPTVARAAADPGADAALRRLWQRRGLPGLALNLITLAPVQFAANLAAGLIDAALVLGEAGQVAGLDAIPLDPAEARAVAPRLALLWRGAFVDA